MPENKGMQPIDCICESVNRTVPAATVWCAVSLTAPIQCVGTAIRKRAIRELPLRPHLHFATPSFRRGDSRIAHTIRRNKDRNLVGLIERIPRNVRSRGRNNCSSPLSPRSCAWPGSACAVPDRASRSTRWNDVYPARFRAWRAPAAG